MNIVQALLGEHGVLKFQIEALRTAAKAGSVDLRCRALALGEAVESHAGLEDELLFDPLEASGRMPPGPISGMRAEHAAIEGLIARLSELGDETENAAATRIWLVQKLCDTLLHHFAHEENALFVLAERFAAPGALEELGARWAARRSVVVGQALVARPA